MKALTIWQPWASLIACGAKQYETRSWATKYRGPIAIHAAMKDPCKLPLLGKEALEQAVREEIDAGRCPTWCFMPRGKIIATAELVNVWNIISKSIIPEWVNGCTPLQKGEDILIVLEKAEEQKSKTGIRYFSHLGASEKEIALGDWTPGRYAWELANVRLLPEPIPIKGKQGLWNWEPEEVQP